MSRPLRYRDFAHRIDVSAFEEAIGFEPLDERYEEDRGYCVLPWGRHNNGDTTGKLYLNREKRVFNCWVCGGGTFLNLAMAIMDMTDEEATEWIHQFAIHEQTESEFVNELERIFHVETAKSKQALPYFNSSLVEDWIKNDHPWFKENGISDEVRELYKVGFNPEAKKYAPMKLGQPVDVPYVGPAIVIPHYWERKLVGWQHRWLTDDRPEWLKKYTNTNDFPREFTLYGYDYALANRERPIVCESPKTTLFLRSQGYSSVATFGSQVTEEQLRLLRRFQTGIYLAPDNDQGGIDFTRKATKYLAPYIPLYLIFPPTDEEKADLGDLSSDPDQLRNSVREAKLALP